jgi:hypothetical protein
VIIGGRLACEAQGSNHIADQRAQPFDVDLLRRQHQRCFSSAAFLLQRAGSRSSA